MNRFFIYDQFFMSVYVFMYLFMLPDETHNSTNNSI